MGNVHAQNVENRDQDEDEVPHPGVMEDFHKKTKDVFPLNFDGLKLTVNKGLSNHFQVSHNIILSTTTPSGYRFGTTYIGSNVKSPTEAYPVLLGDIDPNGNLNANFVNNITNNIRVKFSCQIAKNATNTQVQTDYRGERSSASLTFANLDIKNESGLIVAHYLQAVSRRVALGTELAVQFGDRVPGKEIALMSLAARYSGNESTFSGTLGPHALTLCYYQRASDFLHLGCELETNFRVGESVASIGYQIDLPLADVTFRGIVDSNGNVGGLFEKRLGPLPFTFSLSGMINHYKNNFKLGCGFLIG